MILPTVGVDVDGVLADVISLFCTMLSNRLNCTITPEDIADWHVDGMLPEEDRSEFWEAFSAPGVCRNLAVYDGAKDGLASLERIASVIIVTAYPETAKQWVYERDAWLLAHFGIARSRVVHTSAKHVVAMDVLVDDKPDNIEQYALAQRGGLPILWSHPYNRKHSFYPTVEDRVLRTNSWEKVVEAVYRLR